MVDGLDNEERVLAWLESWNPSFDGVAIVNEDFTFRSVNEQFCKILSVTPGELIDNKFTDITPEPVKTIDVTNAKLVIEGKLKSYLLAKTYEMKDGRKIDVILMVNGVFDQNNLFLFFVSRIMENKKCSQQVAQSHQYKKLSDWFDIKKASWYIFITVVMVLAYLIQEYIKNV